ncbi:MAG: DUF4340 domain-containing protein [Oscillospiraceae bacterium]|nr:DUF4340 domain-containing protein [Oscillospiraceae bacterium]
MKQKRIILVALIAVLAVTVGVIFYLTNNTVDPSLEEDSIHVLTYDREDIQSIEVYNQKDVFTVHSADNEIGYYCEKVEGLPQLLSNYISLVDAVCSVDANSEYKNADLSRYGLDDPQAVMKVGLNDGTEYEIHVGSRAPTENYVYFSVSTQPDTVYTARMSKFSPALADCYSLVNRLLAPKTESPRPGNDETDTAHSITFTNGEGVEYHIDQLSPSYVDGAGNSYRYHQTAPIEGYSQASAIQNVFSRIMQFCASSVYKNQPTEEEIEACGLNDPTTVLTLGYNDEYSTIRLALGPGGNYYAMKEGMDVIWIVADYMVTWLDVQPRTLVTSYVMAPRMDDVSEVSITAYGEAFHITVHDDGTATINGKEVNKGDFSRLYSLACSVNSQNVSSLSGGEEVVRIVFTLKNGGSESVSLLSGESRTLLVYVNDEPMGLSIRESFAETLLEACKAVENTQAFSTNW